MNSNEKFPVITITREYGAGGRTLAKKLSEKYDIPWYDVDLVKIVSAVSGYSVEEIEEEGQEMSKLDKILDVLLNASASYTSSRDEIHRAQTDAILEMAKKPCIIVSRCSNIILVENDIPSFNIFLHADIERRVERAKELQENGESNIEEYIKKRDYLRSVYYETYTKRKIGDYHDYDMLINTGILALDEYVEMIDKGINNKFGLSK